MTPDQYCQEKAAASGSSFYYSFMFLPPDKRRAITALYAFCREVDDVVDECSDENVARTTLNWWRSEVAAIYHGKPQHPVTQALVPLVKPFNLSQEHLLEIIDGVLDLAKLDAGKMLLEEVPVGIGGLLDHVAALRLDHERGPGGRR